MSKLNFRWNLVLLTALLAVLAAIIGFKRPTFICFSNGYDDPASACYIEADRVLEVWDKLHGIHWAARHGRQTRVKELLDEQPELVNSRDIWGRTPLLLAILYHDNQTRGLLLERGARADLHDWFFRTPAYILKKELPQSEFIDLVGGSNPLSSNYAILINLAKIDRLDPFADIWPKFQKQQIQAELLEANNQTLLKTAVENNSIDIATFLVENGVDPYCNSNNWSESALQYATVIGETELVKSVTQKNLRITLLTSGEYGLLDLAVAYRNKDLIHYFLEVGADPNLNNSYLDQPLLHHEVKTNNLEEIPFLLRHRADPNLRDKHKKTPLDYAFEGGNLKTIKLLTTHGAEEMDYATALLQSAKKNRLDLMLLLIGRKDFSRYSDFYGLNPKSRVTTAVHSAAGAGMVDALEFLLSRGADLEVRNENGRSPLIIAVGAGQYRMVDYLISRGADVNSLDNLGNSALSEAAWKGFTPIVELLLGNGAWVDSLPQGATPGPQYVSPLHRAVAAGNGEVLAILIAAGSRMIDIPLPVAFQYAPSSLRSTPLQVAAANQDLFSAELLLWTGADVNFPKDIANGSAVKINSVPPLMAAIFSYNDKPRDFHVIELLLRKGADPNYATENYSSSPVTLAVEAQNVELLETLVDAGARVSFPGRGTLLHTLAYGRTDSSVVGKGTAIVNFLIDHGVKVDARDHLGNTALYIAMALRDQELIEALLNRGASKKLAKTGRLFLD